MTINHGDQIKGECLCHGVQVTGPAGTRAQPAPYWKDDFWGGGRQKCWAVLETPGGMPHDLPVTKVEPA